MVSTPNVGPPPASGISSYTTTLNMRPSSTNGTTSATTKAERASVAIPSATAPTPLPEKVALPLSARHAEPLDLSTVERRGHPTESKEQDHKASRPHGLQEAPTFRPTEEEFKNPMEYIRKIAPEGRKYGIAKIIPPDGWNPDFAIDTERFHFRTRRQELNLAEGGTRANLNYLDQLAKFHKQRNGTNLNRFPSVDKRPLDLYKLKKFVGEKGGFESVCRQKRWAEIGRDLGYSGKIMSSLSTSLKNSYGKWLQPYEDWLKYNKPNVLQQQEIENGGPYTPSPAPTPIKSQQATPNIGASSPAVRASGALNAALLHESNTALPSVETPAPAPLPPAPRYPMSSGFTAVNSGGFTAVNAPSQTPVPPPQVQSRTPIPPSFSAINAQNGMYHTDTGRSTPQRSEASPMSSANTPDMRPTAHSGLSIPPPINGQGLGLKRGLSSEDPDSVASGDGEFGRRSKRRKQDGAPTVTGSYMVQPRLPAPRLQPPRDRSKEKPGDICEQCNKGNHDEAMLLCDSCDAGYHTYCLDPPIKALPDSDWHCPRCLVGRGEFGFEEGAVYSLKQFQERARIFKDQYFTGKMAWDPVTSGPKAVTEEDVEAEFWRLTESLTETVEVEYGADIHSTTHGSGFPTMELHPLNPYAIDPWNLNVLPLHKESLFRHIKTDISGMTVPWLYVGMCFSTFCWHSEDHYTYSANYQHFGATKTWYGIPSEDSDRFEAAMKETVPELFEQQPDLLFQLVTLLQPEKLKKANVRVYALDQRAGQFVITFPQAYHAGFNHGFNFNEAVNFAPADWEPYGGKAIQRLQDFRRQPVFCHEELLFSAAARDHSIKTARWLGPALQKTMERELKGREMFAEEYSKAKNPQSDGADDDSVIGSHVDYPFKKDEKDLLDDDIVCSYCKCYCFLSRMVCLKTQRIVCLLHAGKFECCGSSMEDRCSLKNDEHVIQLRLTDGELTSQVQKIVEVARQPEAWEEKLDKVLEDGPKPSLKAMRTLVTEGEKINAHWELPQLLDLKLFVERCNEWVEEATNYTTRKQQDRRKTKGGLRKGASKAAEDEREKELRNVDKIKKLLEKADDLSFSCPELDTLRERDEKIADFRKRANQALKYPNTPTTELESLIEESKTFGVDIPEIERLEKQSRIVKWFEDAKEHSDRITIGTPLSLQEVTDFLTQGRELGIPENDDYIHYFDGQKQQGEFWEHKAKELMSVDQVNFQQLDALSTQASKLPVSKETLAQIDAMLQKQREIQDKIQGLYERSKDPVFANRPKYTEVRDAMEALAELNSKPPGTLDLEKEQKRHEDWMRRGKKLFGKANAPLHILLQHMKYVEERNDHCLDIGDTPRMPVEPSSRANTPDDSQEGAESGSIRDVFCICRKSEAGMMIECEMCHEWYHGKCLKIARGKVKEDDKYTCPICDYRLKIPRDAARPKIEDLQAWQDEIPGLPFQPEEEECLEKIVNKVTTFRQAIANVLNPLMSTPHELSEQRFYLRKIEGADVLLTDETNFLRAELHKWAPVAPEPPPMIQTSLSTRKPRPTKQQKLMQALGITNPDDLPVHLRPKQPGTKKKEKEGGPGSASGERRHSEQFVPRQPASKGSTGSFTPPGLPHGSTPFSRGPTDFSYDAMAASSYSANPSLFATASHHGLPSHAALTSPTTMGGHGGDLGLADMFGRPSSSTNSKLEPVRPVSLYQPNPVGDTSDPLDVSENFFKEDSHDFLPTFGAETSAFEENMRADAFGEAEL